MMSIKPPVGSCLIRRGPLVKQIDHVPVTSSTLSPMQVILVSKYSSLCLLGRKVRKFEYSYPKVTCHFKYWSGDKVSVMSVACQGN